MSPNIPEAVRDLFQKMHAERQSLLRALLGFTEEQASVHPKGEWSVKQQLAHLANAERAWRDWGLAVYRQPGTVFGPSVDQGQPFEPKAAEQVDAVPFKVWVIRLKSVRAETLRLLREADLQEADLANTGRHRTVGDMNVIQTLRSLYRHDRMHLDQAMGREPTYQPGRRPSARS